MASSGLFIMSGGGGSGSSAWSSLTNAVSSLTLNNGTNATTFNQTSNTTWSWANTTVATISSTNASPIHQFSAQYWNGSASAADTWTIGSSLAAGTNGQSILAIAHSGSTNGNSAVSMPALIVNTAQGIILNSGATLVSSITTSTSTNLTLFKSTNVAQPGMVIQSAGGADNINFGQILLTAGASMVNTSGTIRMVDIGNAIRALSGIGVTTYAPTSGTCNFTTLAVSAVTNQTGGASGTITDIMVNSKETAVVGTHNFLDLQAGSAGTTSKYTIVNSGIVSNYNSEATAAVGHPYIRGSTSQKSETGADTNVLTVTPAAAAGSYRLRIVISISAANAAVIGWTATWTDSNGNAQTPTNLALFQVGTAAPALTFTTSVAGNYHAECDVDINNAGTNIVIKTTFSGTSVAY
jgi:hypothetical protein